MDRSAKSKVTPKKGCDQMIDRTGHYRARAIDWDFGRARTGTEQIAVCFEVLEGPYEGQRIQWFGYFTPAALPVTVRALRAAGLTGNDLTKLDGLGTRDVDLVVEMDPDRDGIPRPRVKWVNEVRERHVVLQDVLSNADRHALAERFRDAIAAIDQETHPDVVGRVNDTDDIAF